MRETFFIEKIGAVFLSTVFIVGMMNLGGTAKANGPDAIRIKQAKERVLSSKIVKGIKDSGTKRTSVVVELTSPPVAVPESLKKKKRIKPSTTQRQATIKQLQKEISTLKIDQQYDTVFSGFSASLEGTDIKKSQTDISQHSL